MKTTFALSSLLALTSAEFFSAISARSASPVHLLPVTASGQKIYLGGNTATYCPSNIEPTGGCPNKNYTTFSATEGPTTVSMGAVVPGGQQLYIDPACGALGYTQAHSALQPEGAIVEGFTLSAPGPNGLGSLSVGKGFVACPAEGGVYQVFATGVEGVSSEAGQGEGCLGFDMLTSHEAGASAWQYE